jgi:hypothetical protein
MGKIIMSKEADRFANRLSAASTANPVDIILGMTGKVVINHVGDAFHIDSARGDVGCDEDADSAGLKILKRTETLILRSVGVKSCAGDSQGFQATGNPVGPVFCSGKNKNSFQCLLLQEVSQ